MTSRSVGTVTSMFAACAASILCLSAPAEAQTVANTFGPNLAFSQSSNFAFGALPTAMRFVPSSSGVIATVELALRADSTVTPSVVTVRIVPEVANLPGPNAVWSGTISGVLAASVYAGQTTTQTSPLVAGQTYWVVLTATGSTRWFFGSPASAGGVTSQNAPGQWNNPITFSQSAFRINLMEPIGACCSRLTGACTVISTASCTALGATPLATGTACIPAACPPACPADFNNSGSISIDDIFSFLQSWFSGCL